ncbi:RecQ family ATP-dependent DNA helicase [Halotalea alkalilenta]|uniref:ATP-dependent DNA helicase RecQ n=1 Tax=Halotalea alkalilenta TaxID=376489 RepID=A0A172YGW7_9GAMM|nr:RecQ family ATP-dependent DNA helicase [Halotalea alkalilenta]ANF58530.1 recombinase RecQ [Halotalea alkalilenta]
MSSETLDYALARHFGFEGLRPGQRAVIERLLEGRSVAAIFPTGAGKSLCYQLPALMLPHLTLVISPLLALIKDQLAFLHAHGIAAASIDSSQSPDEGREVMRQAQAGELKILMISVERLRNERFRRFISQVPISLLVVDEAHCISEWGHNFRPDYLKLPEERERLGMPRTLLLTATATPPVVEQMRERFSITADDVITTGFYRPNLELEVLPTAQAQRPQRLVEWLAPRAGHQAAVPQPSIVYVTQQRSAEEVARLLTSNGIAARAYHAGLDSEERQTIQTAFKQGELNCIVATIAFGMGIDKSDIRQVIHFDPPKSIENYSQEIGRAGRDGAPSTCLTLASREGLGVLENFIYGDTPERSGIRCLLEELDALPRASSGERDWRFTLSALSQRTDIRPLPLKTLLVQLELLGVATPRFSHFADYRFAQHEDDETLAGHFQGERRDFIALLLNNVRRARRWASVDFDRIDEAGRAAGLDAGRGRVIAALEFFAQRGWIELEAKQLTEVYAVYAGSLDIEGLSLRLHDYFTQREHAELERLRAVPALLESEHCLSHRLAAYFGDPRAPQHCGHCSVCHGRTARLPRPQPEPLPDRPRLSALCAPLHARLAERGNGHTPSATLLARFLCGLSSPLLTQLKARTLPGYGALATSPYAALHAHITTLALGRDE